METFGCKKEKSNHVQTFKIGLNSDSVRGIYYNTNWRSYVFLKFQESIEDVISTCVHESLHAAIDHCSTWEDDELEDDILEQNEAFYIDDDIEHIIIQKIMWIDDLISN